jgi:rubrerythrin
MASIYRRGPYQWQVLIRRKGYPTQAKVFETKAEAEAWSKTTESEMVRGVFVSRKEAENTTLAEALDRYLKEITENKKGAY